jgi:hypothetical protein
MLSAPLSNVYAVAGDYTVLPAIAGKRIVVISSLITSSAAITLTFKSASTAITGPMYVGASGLINLDAVHGQTGQDECWILKTNVGEALVITASAAATIGGYITYRYELV